MKSLKLLQFSNRNCSNCAFRYIPSRKDKATYTTSVDGENVKNACAHFTVLYEEGVLCRTWKILLNKLRNNKVHGLAEVGRSFLFLLMRRYYRDKRH